jgi:hypothetical protein
MIPIEDLSGLREQFLGGVPNPGRAIAQYPSKPRYMVGAASLIFSTQLRWSAAISAPNASAARSTCWTLTSTDANWWSSALLSATLTNPAPAAGHPHDAWGERKQFPVQNTIARKESALALGAVIVGLLQMQRTQHTLSHVFRWRP